MPTFLDRFKMASCPLEVWWFLDFKTDWTLWRQICKGNMLQKIMVYCRINLQTSKALKNTNHDLERKTNNKALLLNVTNCLVSVYKYRSTDRVKAYIKCFPHPFTKILYPFNGLSKQFKYLPHPLKKTKTCLKFWINC